MEDGSNSPKPSRPRDLRLAIKRREFYMAKTASKEILIKEIEEMPVHKVKDVLNFVHYLKIKEDDWFIDLVNRRSRQAESDRKAGKKFIGLRELQEEYRKG